jgi:hypothetical protein
MSGATDSVVAGEAVAAVVAGVDGAEEDEVDEALSFLLQPIKSGAERRPRAMAIYRGIVIF